MLIVESDNDMVMYDEPDKTANQISIYGARGMLIESQGPSWFYGTGSEHAVLYNYQLSNAKNVREETCLISKDQRTTFTYEYRSIWVISKLKVPISSPIR
jgi:hypothetical protein